MARLPVPGGDDGTWGDILNEFLGVSHNADGTLSTVPVSQGGTGATNAATARNNLGITNLPSDWAVTDPDTVSVSDNLLALRTGTGELKLTDGSGTVDIYSDGDSMVDIIASSGQTQPTIRLRNETGSVVTVFEPDGGLFIGDPAGSTGPYFGAQIAFGETYVYAETAPGQTGPIIQIYDEDGNSGLEFTSNSTASQNVLKLQAMPTQEAAGDSVLQIVDSTNSDVFRFGADGYIVFQWPASFAANGYGILKPDGLSIQGETPTPNRNTIDLTADDPSANHGAYLWISTHENQTTKPVMIGTSWASGDLFTIAVDGSAKLQNASSLRSGTGVPSNSIGVNGDYYFRRDGGAGTHIYFKTGGAWSALI